MITFGSIPIMSIDTSGSPQVEILGFLYLASKALFGFFAILEVS